MQETWTQIKKCHNEEVH